MVKQQKKKIPEKKPAPGTGTRQGGSGRNGWLPWVSLALILVLAVIGYFPSLYNQFSNWDDPDYVLENQHVRALSAENTAWFFTHSSAANYHPLTMLSLSADYQLAAGEKAPGKPDEMPSAFPFHLTNLLLHLLNTMLVFLFIWKLSDRRLPVTLITTLLFAVHPIHVESVAWIAERKDVLYTFFFLAALVAYLEYTDRRKWYFLLATGGLFLLSLFSKPSAVVLPLVLIAIDFFRGRKDLTRLILEKVPFLLLSLVFGLITYFIQSGTAVLSLKSLSVFDRAMIACYGLIMYPVHMIFPAGLSPFYPYPDYTESGNLPLVFYLAPVIVLAIVAAGVWSFRHTRVVVFASMFYLINLILVLQVLPVGNPVMADRYSYVSAIGLFFLAGWSVDRLMASKKEGPRRAGQLLLVLLLVCGLLLTWMTRSQVKVWKNPETIWTAVIEKYPGCAIAFNGRGSYYAKTGQTDKALGDYLSYVRLSDTRKSVYQRNENADVYRNLGNIFGERGETDKALEAYAGSLAADSSSPATFRNRAITFSRAGRFREAADDYTRIVALSAAAADDYANRGFCLRSVNDFEPAIADFDRALALNPANDNYYLQRGVCYFQLGRIAEAKDDFEKCLSLNPGNGNACFDLAVINNQLKDYKQAYLYVQKAVSLGYAADAGFVLALKQKAGK